MRKILGFIATAIRELFWIVAAIAIVGGGYFGFQYLGDNREVVSEESLFRNELDEKQSEVIIVVISQVNFMLCFFNDMLDLKMIEQGNFVTVNEGYRPHEVFNYVLSIFKQ